MNKISSLFLQAEQEFKMSINLCTEQELKMWKFFQDFYYFFPQIFSSS